MAKRGSKMIAELAVLVGFLSIRIDGQSVSEPVVSMLRNETLAASDCGACNLYPATTNIAAGDLDPSATLPNTYVLFTAYSIVSAYITHGVCITTTGPQIYMAEANFITKPPNADPTAFQSSAAARFIDYLGFSTCSAGINVVVNIPTNVGNPTTSTLPSLASVRSPSSEFSRPANSSITPLLAAPSTFTTATTLPSPTLNRPSSGISTGAKVAIGAVIPVIGIASLSLLTIYLWRKRKRSQAAKGKDHTSDSPDDTQPYFQQKAELDSEEKRQQELDARELRYEMDGAQGRYEIEGSDGSYEVSTERRRQGLLSLGQTHELRGEEHSTELGGPEVL